MKQFDFYQSGIKQASFYVADSEITYTKKMTKILNYWTSPLISN